MKLSLRTIARFSDDKTVSIATVEGLQEKTWVVYAGQGKYVIRAESEPRAEQERYFESPEAALAELERLNSV
jgi:hypothetical protein